MDKKKDQVELKEVEAEAKSKLEIGKVTETSETAKVETKKNQEKKTRKEKKKEKKRKKKGHIGIIIVCTLLPLILLAYFGISLFFQTRFFPNVIINGVDCSYMLLEEVTELIRLQSLEYYLEVYDQDGELAGVVEAADIGLSIEVDQDVRQLLENQDELRWIFEFFDSSRHEIVYDVEFDRRMLRSVIREWDAFSLTKMEEPRNAYISDYSSEIKGYEIIPETRGNRIIISHVEKAMVEAIYDKRQSINLEEENCYFRAAITSDNKRLNNRVAKLNKLTGTRIVYDWNGSEFVLDGDIVHEWIVEEDTDVFSIDEEAVREFVVAMAEENDTYGQKRVFVTTSGREVDFSGGAFGWRTDRNTETEELLALLQSGAVTDREPVYRNTGWTKGKDDIGPSYVEINLSAQHLYLYIDGELILDSALVSGNMSRGWGTPGGVFGLTYKTRNAVLRGEGYATPVSYWMPFNGNIGMHDATWRGSFGGDIYLTSGSHGCINLPFSIAKELYSHVSTGFPVICYY